MRITILGLTITSSWGNGHATTFRSLCRALQARGHQIDFVEKDVEWYRSNRDLPEPSYCKVHLYDDWNSKTRKLIQRLAKSCDVIVIGSYFPDAIAATHLLLETSAAPILFYDIDTPITLSALRTEGHTEYLQASDIPHYAAYMSFTGGPVLREISTRFGSPYAVPLYCSVDESRHHRTPPAPAYVCDLSYLGTYAPDRQPKLLELLHTPAEMLPASNFIVAGPKYPTDTVWPANVHTIIHISPPDHPAFYSSSRFTLNLTRDEMILAGYSPSVRLFEASACGAAILSDWWTGLDTFLQPGEEILIPEDATEVISILTGLSDEQRFRIGERARERILTSHTASHRAKEFEDIVEHVYAIKEQPSAPRTEVATETSA